MKRDSAGFGTVLALILVLVLAPSALGASVAELRERLLAPETPSGERSHLASRLLAAGKDGENVLRAVLLAGDEALVRPVVRCVLVQTHEPLLVEVLPHATPSDFERCRSRKLVKALASLAGKADSGAAGQALLGLESARGRDAVGALMDLWEAEVAGARDALRRVLPMEFPSVGEARAWWAGQAGKSYETILLELLAEQARPSAADEGLRERHARLRKAHIDLARAGLATAGPTLVAEAYLASELVEIRRLGADHLKALAKVADQERPAFSEGLLRALTRHDEEAGTLVALLGAARVHVAGLKALAPEGRVWDTVRGFRERTEREVRLGWVDLLGELGDRRASGDLEALYDDADSTMRGRIIDALLGIGNGVVEWARAALLKQLDLGPELDVEVTGKLVNLLGRRGGSDDVGILAQVLRDVKNRTPEDFPAEKIRRFAAEALGTAGVKRDSPEAIQALVDVGLRDSSPGVRQKSAAALAAAKGSAEVVTALEDRLREDDKVAVKLAAADSLLALLGLEAGPRLAPYVGADEGLLERLDHAVKKALEAAKIEVLRTTVERLLAVDPAKTVEFCERIGAASWPAGAAGDLAAVKLVHARALCRVGQSSAALAVLGSIPADAPVPEIRRCVVRALALRTAGRPGEAFRVIDDFMARPGSRMPANADLINLRLERIRVLIAIPRLDEALAAHGSLSADSLPLTAADRETLAILAKAIEQARTRGRTAEETTVDAWLDGSGGDGALARARALGARAHPALLARLNLVADGPALSAFFAKLRQLTGKDFGGAKATSPAARNAVRERWRAFLSGT